MTERQFQARMAQYDYSFSPDVIADKPAIPRDSARLLIYDKTRDMIAQDTFLHLNRYLPSGAVLVFNQTKVIPARLTVTKETGGKAIITYLETISGLWKVLADRRLTITSKISIAPGYVCIVEKQEEKYFYLKPLFDEKKRDTIFIRWGTMPLPPYIHNPHLTEKQKRSYYQTIFATQSGSVAAPTASLHFTPRVLKKLSTQGIDMAYITLHVGLGTFAPLEKHHLIHKKLHEEAYTIDAATARLLNTALTTGRPIIPVGTTSLRALESAYQHGHIQSGSATTHLFITESYRHRVASGIITNFHVPRSSLLMLVSSFIGREKILKLYEYALNHQYRFFSFGDGMLILSHNQTQKNRVSVL